MRVLLVNPPVTLMSGDPTKFQANVPLGLLYIAGYLEKHGYKPKILDCVAEGIGNESGNRIGLSDDEIRREIEKQNPDVVGVTTQYTAYADDSHRICGIVKDTNKDISTVVGGSHASTHPEVVITDEHIDAVIIGEGERAFLDVLENGERGIIRQRHIKNLDEIPFPARHLVDIDVYFTEQRKNPYLMRHPATSLITSRGCPMNCRYCSVSLVWGRSWRAHSADYVLDELEHLKRHYGVREVFFYDDNVSVDKKRFRAILDGMVERDLDLKFSTPNGIAHWTLNVDIIRRMKKAGCYRLVFGIESGSQRTREYIGGKGRLDLIQATRMLREAHRQGIWTVCTFILGFPHETEVDMTETMNYAGNCGADLAVFFLLRPLPKTGAYRDFEKAGLIDWDVDSKEGLDEMVLALAQEGVHTATMTKERLREMQGMAHKYFWRGNILRWLNPMTAVRKIHSLEDLRYLLKMAGLGLRIRGVRTAREIESTTMIRGKRDGD